MSFLATAVFRCDGCKVVESEAAEVTSDMTQVTIPKLWLRVETVKLVPPGDMQQPRPPVFAVRHFCPDCTPNVESYIAGRREETAQ